MYVGVDHSTTAMKVGVIDERHRKTFAIERTPGSSFDFLGQLSEHVDLDEIEMTAIGYSYGDDISEIVRLEETTNRGIEDPLGLGHNFGTGTQVFDELLESDVPCVAFPGIHRDIDSLHPYFKFYSHLTGADKVATARFAQGVVAGRNEQQVATDGGPPDDADSGSFISANVSSSCMATLVCDGELKGAFHWLGLVHGLIDVETIRDVKRGDKSLDDVYMQSGLVYKTGKGFDQIYGTPDADLLENLHWATLHHIHSLRPFSEHVEGEPLDRIVLSGRLSRVTEPYDLRGRLSADLSDVAPVSISPEHSTAIGAAQIAEDVANGANDVLGIPVA